MKSALQANKNRRKNAMDMMEKLSLAGLVPVIKVEDAADAVSSINMMRSE